MNPKSPVDFRGAFCFLLNHGHKPGTLQGNLYAKEPHMAKKPNYNFEKRQKELAKKAKQDEKKRRKLEGSSEEAESEEQQVEP